MLFLCCPFCRGWLSDTGPGRRSRDSPALPLPSSVHSLLLLPLSTEAEGSWQDALSVEYGCFVRLLLKLERWTADVLGVVCWG